MNNRKLKVVGLDAEEVANIVSETLEKEHLKQNDRKRKEDNINKALKKDTMLNKHVHDCPSCHSKVKVIKDGFEVCEDCGTTTAVFKKGQKPLVCDDCGGIVSVDTKNCPGCGGTKAHWAK